MGPRALAIFVASFQKGRPVQNMNQGIDPLAKDSEEDIVQLIIERRYGFLGSSIPVGFVRKSFPYDGFDVDDLNNT